MPIMGSENFDIFHDKDRGSRTASPGLPNQLPEKDGYSQKVSKVGTSSVSSGQPGDDHQRSAAEISAEESRLVRKIDLR